MRRLLNRQLARTLGWIALLVLVAVGINVVGIGVAGDVDGWNRWLDEHASHFLVWRLFLYGATIYGWIWMRQRLLIRDGFTESRRRLLRTEIGAVAAIALLEFSVFWQQT